MQVYMQLIKINKLCAFFPLDLHAPPNNFIRVCLKAVQTNEMSART